MLPVHHQPNGVADLDCVDTTRSTSALDAISCVSRPPNSSSRYSSITVPRRDGLK